MFTLLSLSTNKPVLFSLISITIQMLWQLTMVSPPGLSGCVVKLNTFDDGSNTNVRLCVCVFVCLCVCVCVCVATNDSIGLYGFSDTKRKSCKMWFASYSCKVGLANHRSSILTPGRFSTSPGRVREERRPSFSEESSMASLCLTKSCSCVGL